MHAVFFWEFFFLKFCLFKACSPCVKRQRAAVTHGLVTVAFLRGGSEEGNGRERTRPGYLLYAHAIGQAACLLKGSKPSFLLPSRGRVCPSPRSLEWPRRESRSDRSMPRMASAGIAKRNQLERRLPAPISKSGHTFA